MQLPITEGIAGFSPALLEQIVPFFEKHSISKNSLLISEGQVCRHLWFLEKGCMRGFYNIHGRDVTQWFGFENNFVTSFRSFISRKPSVESIQAVEDCELWRISYEDLMQLLQTHVEAERYVRKMYEHYYIRLEERYSNAHFKTAVELYDDMLQNQPHIIQRIPLGHIASYLGITQETLSRIRKKK